METLEKPKKLQRVWTDLEDFCLEVLDDNAQEMIECMRDLPDELKKSYVAEYKSRDGFWSHIDGGVSLKSFISIDSMVGSGYFPSNKKARKAIDHISDWNYKEAKEEFIRQNQGILKDLKLPNDKINYHDLYEIDRGDLAEKLSEIESEYNTDDNDVMFKMDIIYYQKGSYKNPFGDKHDCLHVQGYINWEAPYFRQNPQWESVVGQKSVIVNWKNLDKTKERVTKAVKKIVSKF